MVIVLEKTCVRSEWDDNGAQRRLLIALLRNRHGVQPGSKNVNLMLLK